MSWYIVDRIAAVYDVLQLMCNESSSVFFFFFKIVLHIYIICRPTPLPKVWSSIYPLIFEKKKNPLIYYLPTSLKINFQLFKLGE